MGSRESPAAVVSGYQSSVVLVRRPVSLRTTLAWRTGLIDRMRRGLGWCMLVGVAASVALARPVVAQVTRRRYRSTAWGLFER